MIMFPSTIWKMIRLNWIGLRRLDRRSGVRARQKLDDGGISSMIRKSLTSGFDPMGGIRFSEKHALRLDPRDHAQTKSQSGMPIEPQLIPL